MPGDLKMPDDETTESIMLAVPVFDADQANYIMALSCVYPDSSLDDLEKSFNVRYKKQTYRAELEQLLQEARRTGAAGGPAGAGIFDNAVIKDAFTFWNEDGFPKDENDKLFILTTYRQAHDAAIKKSNHRDGSGSVASDLFSPQPESYLREATAGFLSYEDIRHLSYKDLMKVYYERRKRQDQKTQAE
ncbi:MAG: hypothetical protein Q9224_007534 [Gallowayella concinna]